MFPRKRSRSRALIGYEQDEVIPMALSRYRGAARRPAEQHLHLPPAGLAWLIGAIRAGALVGPLIPNTLARDYCNAH